MNSILVNLPKCDILKDVTSECTHVVIGNECKRTVKVLKGILCGSWIVKSSWVQDSLKSRRWLPEEGYEVSEAFPGAKLSREDPSGPLLFEGKKFALLGKVTPAEGEMTSLLEMAGAKVNFKFCSSLGCRY
jgi:BRCA1-associated RING domain protein 1